MGAIEEALAVLARGGMVVVADDDDRENEGDLVMAADAMTDSAIIDPKTAPTYSLPIP